MIFNTYMYVSNRRRKEARGICAREAELLAVAWLALSHIDSLHSTEPLAYYSHTGLDNFTDPTHTHPIFPGCLAVSYTAAPGVAMLGHVLPSEIKGERGECSKPRRGSPSTACN